MYIYGKSEMMALTQMRVAKPIAKSLHTCRNASRVSVMRLAAVVKPMNKQKMIKKNNSDAEVVFYRFFFFISFFYIKKKNSFFLILVR